jgi:uncharacterized membrane protein YukC
MNGKKIFSLIMAVMIISSHFMKKKYDIFNTISIILLVVSILYFLYFWLEKHKT